MRWTVDGGLLSRDTIDWLDDRYRAYLRGEVSELAICGEMVQIYQGLRESEMRSAAAEFFATRIEPNLFPEMLALVRQLQARSTQIWAVSSTCNWVIDAVFGNSIHDAAMLAIARRAFPVNPSADLLQRSIRENWPVYYPAAVAPA